MSRYACPLRHEKGARQSAAQTHGAWMPECIDDGGGRRQTPSSPIAPLPCRVTDTIRLGMPHLSLNGLSENWLLKELGDRHWMMLARMAGQDGPNFVDDRGAPVYAAFCALSVRDGDFASARENQRLTIVSELGRISRSQMFSRHRLEIAGRPVGSVDLISAFVRRAADGGNHGVSRFAVTGLPPLDSDLRHGELAGQAASMRSGKADSHMDFAVRDRPVLFSRTFDPCPSLDFNGAGFLYFSSFASFVDRAEWEFARDLSLSATTLRRDIFFAANIDPGERLFVQFLDFRREEFGFSHHCNLFREEDGMLLARVFTNRGFAR